MAILDPIVGWFDGISVICTGVAVLPSNDVSALPPFTTTTVLGLESSLGNGSELELVVKLYGSTVVSTSCAGTTWVEPAVVALGLILSANKGTESVLVVDILDPIAVWFDDISAISIDVAVLPVALIWLGPVVAIASG